MPQVETTPVIREVSMSVQAEMAVSLLVQISRPVIRLMSDTLFPAGLPYLNYDSKKQSYGIKGISLR